MVMQVGGQARWKMAGGGEPFAPTPTLLYLLPGTLDWPLKVSLLKQGYVSSIWLAEDLSVLSSWVCFLPSVPLPQCSWLVPPQTSQPSAAYQR